MDEESMMNEIIIGIAVFVCTSVLAGVFLLLQSQLKRLFKRINHLLLCNFAMFEAFKLKKNFNILYSRRLRKSIKKDIDTVVLAKRISYIYWLQNFGIFVMLVFIGLFILL